MKRISKDDIRTFIVVALVCITSVVLILVLSMKSNSEKLANVKEYNDYFSSINYINKYLSTIESKDREKVYNYLYDEYLNKNAITRDSILNKLRDYPSDANLNVESMKYVKIKNNYLYYIKGKLILNTFSSKEVVEDNYQVILLKDYSNKTFSVYPLNNNDNYKKIIDKIRKIDIQKNNDNLLDNKTELITKEQICVLYLSNYLNNVRDDINSSYSSLSDTMKKKNEFSSLENYRSYINQNSSKLTTVADKCYVEKIDNKRVYTVIDKNENTYKFTEEYVMKYTVDLFFKQ